MEKMVSKLSGSKKRYTKINTAEYILKCSGVYTGIWQGGGGGLGAHNFLTLYYLIFYAKVSPALCILS